MDRKELLKYGNEFTIMGLVVGNANEHEVIILPGEWESYLDGEHVHQDEPLLADDETIQQIFRQLDVQEIEGLQKVILRKSQRNIDQRVAWQVFRRDEFRCVYCGDNTSPMTVDHIVLWELMGDTHPDNLNCSCKKCNKTRGSMDYTTWLHSDALVQIRDKSKQYLLHWTSIDKLQLRGVKAKEVPLRKMKRSR